MELEMVDFWIDIYNYDGDSPLVNATEAPFTVTYSINGEHS